MEDKTAAGAKKGKSNLVILGFVSIFIAILTTSISLVIYHNSGDIYLDGSRPGYLPVEEEVEEEEIKAEEYNFEKSGSLTKEILSEYLEKINLEIEAIDRYEEPFGENGLSDEVLGIPAE